jgi:hypothetical protein
MMKTASRVVASKGLVVSCASGAVGTAMFAALLVTAVEGCMATPADVAVETSSAALKTGNVTYNYLGCFSDSNQRALPYLLQNGVTSIESCVAAAQAANHAYAGLQYGGECWAGDAPTFESAPYSALPNTSCQMPCSGNGGEACGGVWANLVFSVAAQDVAPAQQAGASYVGCYSDAPTRALPALLLSSGATVASCVAAARNAGYIYAGLQDAGQCFAGNTLGYSALPQSSCWSPCSANSSEMCGGGWANSVFNVIQFPNTGSPFSPTSIVLEDSAGVPLPCTPVYASSDTTLPWNNVALCEDTADVQSWLTSGVAALQWSWSYVPTPTAANPTPLVLTWNGSGWYIVPGAPTLGPVVTYAAESLAPGDLPAQYVRSFFGTIIPTGKIYLAFEISEAAVGSENIGTPCSGTCGAPVKGPVAK